MKRVLTMAVILIIVLCGCEINSVDITEQNFDKDMDLINYSISKNEYTGIIEEMIINKGKSTEEVEGFISRYKEYLTSSFIEKYRATATNDTNDEYIPIEGEDFTFHEPNTDENYLEPTVEPEPTVGTTIEHTEANNSLFSRSLLGTIFAYAIEEEDTNEGEEYNPDDEPVFKVMYIDAYNDRLIATGSYKFGGAVKIWVALVDGKIDGYTIYR